MKSSRKSRPRSAARAHNQGAPDVMPHGSRPEQVYTRLRDLIVQGLLAPGSRIVETEIATRLGVSRTPVREALQRLQQEGYVVGSAGAQSRLTVVPLTRTDVDELLHIVGALEGLGARHSAGLPAAARKALAHDLQTLNKEFHRATRPGDPLDHGRLYDADQHFHRALVEASAGPRLLSLHRAVKPQAERYIRMYISMLTGDIRPSVDEHERIIDAIEAGNVEEAERAVELNWRHAADRLIRVIDVAGERGQW